MPAPCALGGAEVRARLSGSSSRGTRRADRLARRAPSHPGTPATRIVARICSRRGRARDTWLLGGSEREPLNRRGFCCRRSLVAQLLIPVRWTSFGSEIEQIPERLDRAGVTRVLIAVGCGVEELCGPEMADRVLVAMEYVQH